jgi:hypothetical protein
VDASPRTKTRKECEELLQNTAKQEMKTELGRGKRPRKQAQYSFERHIHVYVEEDEVNPRQGISVFHRCFVEGFIIHTHLQHLILLVNKKDGCPIW